LVLLAMVMIIMEAKFAHSCTFAVMQDV